MTIRFSGSLSVALAVATFLALGGCEKEPSTFEDVGEEIDNRVDYVRDAVEDAIDEAERRLEELDEN